MTERVRYLATWRSDPARTPAQAVSQPRSDREADTGGRAIGAVLSSASLDTVTSAPAGPHGISSAPSAGRAS